ncbi:uncharacterized protein LOC124121008 [Haliotis rufescens]|uniref:uncharacterized protein LOC124121008 n=1 Tax=Haliotis rufescens TaxID=6454 RepID=UPI00201E8967|nr:uncharacterized protein LOC124121008 [Haliotis rufescens]
MSSDTFLPSPCQSDEEPVSSDTFLPSPCQSDEEPVSSDTFILSPCQSDEESESSDSYVSSPYQSSDEDAHPECMATRVETNVLQPKHDVERDAHQQFTLTEEETVKMTSDELKGLHIYPQGFREFLASSHKHVEKGLVKLLSDTHTVVYGNTCVLETLSTKQTPPSSLLFDVCIFRPSQPLLLISVTSQHDSTTVLYNSALARKVKTFMRREIKPNFSLVHGVVEESEFKLEESLRSQVNALATQAMWVSLPHSLFMDPALCKMITANFIVHVQHDTFDQSKDAGNVQPSPPQIQEAKPLCGNEFNLKEVMQCKEQLQMNQSWLKQTEPSRARVSSEETEFNPHDIEQLGDIVYHLGVFERKDVGGPKCPEQTSRSTNPCVFHDPMMQMVYILSGMTLGGADEIPDMAEDSLVSSCGSKILLLHGDDDALPTDEDKGLQRLMVVLSKIDWIVLWRRLRRLVMNTKKEIIHLQAKVEYLQQLLQDNTSLNQSSSRKTKIPGRKIPDADAENKPFFVHRLTEDKCRLATRCQVHQLRQFQQGILRHKHMFEIIRHGIHADTDRRTCLQTRETVLEKDYGCVHMFGEVGSPRAYHVVCPTLHFDTSLVNTMYCDVTRGCELVNTSSFNTSEHNDATRLQNYSGTRSSTAIPLHPPTSMLPGPQYWECHTRVTPRKPIGAWLTLLEVGVCEESQVDTGVWLYSRPRSWSVRVGGCSWHRSSICTFVYDGEQNVHCTLDTMCNTPDTSDYISYGVVLDVVRGRLAFIDLNRVAVLSMIDVEFGEALCPTFGVGPWSNEYSIRMKLISGKNIKLTESKKSLIHKVLS